MSEEKTNVEEYKFEPIKGYPMLQWKGKKPFSSTRFYPAQLKEEYGAPDGDGWMNKVFWGDNIQVMSHLLKEHRNSIDLVYIDPPFDSNATYNRTISLKGDEVKNDYNVFEETQYSDIWNNDGFLQHIYERLVLLRELISDSGSLMIHMGPLRAHYVKIICDEVFGANNFLNDIIWKRTPFAGSSKARSNKFPVNHDNIFWYCKNKERFKFNRQYEEYSEEYKRRFKHKDDVGYYRKTLLKTYSKKTEDRLKAEDRWIDPVKEGAYPSYKQYLHESKGKQIEDIWEAEYSDTDMFWISNVWEDINLTNPMAKERTDYPTQKPNALLKRIIESVTDENDLVFDCYMGSGTTLDVANSINRRFIGADINLGSIDTTKKRLVRELASDSVGLEIYNVNNYDLFRNPVEAKQLLLEALEIQKIDRSIYDGEKDGQMVKIMPVNRIATRADLNELVNGFDYKVFAKRKEEAPSKPVEKILLICMGHEPDLKAGLVLAAKEAGFDIAVEIVDILRDKSDLEFKREAEAKIKVKGKKLIIDKFYPLNLLQKLSLQKSKVDNWKDLVESVLIDWNYDGAVLSPQVMDIPEKSEKVVGEYEIPAESGTIRVKITDLLSESIEIEVQNG